MTMIEHVRRLFSYDDWANHEVLASLEAVETPTQRSLNLLAHIIAAEMVWLDRMLVRKQSWPVWPQLTIQQLRVEIEKLAEVWKDYLSSLGEAGLSTSTTYKNTEGQTFTSQKQDILMHVVMHSAYHRGQIAADMRAAGFTPAYTDFIHGVRQGFVDRGL